MKARTADRQSAVGAEAEQPGSGLSGAAQDVHQRKLIVLCNPVYLHLIDAVIHRAEKTVVRRRHHTVHMWPEISLRHAAETSVKYAVHHASQTAILMGMHNRHLSVVIARHKEILPGLIHRQITASHSIYIHFIDQMQISVFSHSKDSNALVSYGIQIFPVQRPADMGRIVHRNHFPFRKRSLFHINIVQMYAYAASMSICSHVCNVFLIAHLRYTLSYLSQRSYGVPLKIHNVSIPRNQFRDNAFFV